MTAGGIDQALAFLDEVELAGPGGQPLAGRRRGAADAAQIEFKPGDQALAAGSQLIEFDPSIDPALRSAITNSILLAQLAANKAVPAGPIDAWYAKYLDVLAHIGWITSALTEQDRSFAGATGEVNKAISGALAAALGPGAAATSILLAALKGLETSAGDSPWIAVFDQATRQSQYSSFQLSYASANGNTPTMRLLCFSIDETSRSTQVLFFRFGDGSANLRLSSGEITAATDQLLQTKDRVAAMLAGKADAYLSSIDI